MIKGFTGLFRALMGEAEAERVLARVFVPEVLDRPVSAEAIPRACVAQALNVALLARSMSEVPDLARYADEQLASAEPRRIFLDHGAVRSVRHVRSGELPEGQQAFTRFLQPLGYSEAATYPLPGLRMLGHAWRHDDLPEEVAQYFISELNADAFSPEFQRSVERVVESSRDPLSARSEAALEHLRAHHTLPLDKALALVNNLLSCFATQHKPPSWRDYERLLEESAEMAWIATEGHTFNHATDRVEDVDALAEHQRSLGRSIKAQVEVSSAGTVRQTAYKAVSVWRTFIDDDGGQIQRVVPGSFFELISRGPHPEEAGLDLRFDASNAQGIFAMTRR